MKTIYRAVRKFCTGGSEAGLYRVGDTDGKADLMTTDGRGKYFSLGSSSCVKNEDLLDASKFVIEKEGDDSVVTTQIEHNLMQAALALANPAGKRLQFNYTDTNGRQTRARSVKVALLEGSKVTGYDDLRDGEYRTFLVDKMSNVSTVNYVPPPPPIVYPKPGDVFTVWGNAGRYLFAEENNLVLLSGGTVETRVTPTAHDASTETAFKYWFNKRGFDIVLKNA